MTQEPPRSISPSAVQATGQVASDVVAGLKGQPVILGLIVLNCIGIGAAVWFLRELAADSRATKDELLELVEYCVRGKTDMSPGVPGR